MKTIAAFLVLFAFSANAQTDFSQVKSQAKSQHKHILLNFSGSDWCGPCLVFTNEFLGNPQFKAFESDALVFVNADFPRKKKNQLPAESAKANDALAEKYNPNGIFPYTLLLDSDGKVVKSWQGKPNVPVAEWIFELKNLCN
ncbi:thioredoxin family protein [Flavobacterium sp.]|uniref:thioredoxin family protein n=1 Tax=Flavobacterium sp. TaxID=239 RepID=UPI00121BE230|nr:thioredoxin family protein [Flavobacterium sp.]RZJ72716.1 MAG: thioredoxin family protein [Flavobacterium sp.]